MQMATEYIVNNYVMCMFVCLWALVCVHVWFVVGAGGRLHVCPHVFIWCARMHVAPLYGNPDDPVKIYSSSLHVWRTLLTQ